MLDDFNREGLGIDADFSLPAVRVMRALDQIIQWRGKPDRLRCDNGPEFISQDLKRWAEDRNIQVDFIHPGNPQQNAYVERYNHTVRYSWLSQYQFDSIKDHVAIVTGGGRKSVQHSTFKWVNTMLGNVKNSLLGTFHAIREKHVPRYLAEFGYRFNRRFNLLEMIERLIFVALRTPPMPYRLLRMAEVYG